MTFDRRITKERETQIRDCNDFGVEVSRQAVTDLLAEIDRLRGIIASAERDLARAQDEATNGYTAVAGYIDQRVSLARARLGMAEPVTVPGPAHERTTQ